MYRVEIHNLRLDTVEPGTTFDSPAAAEAHADHFNKWARRMRLSHLLFRAVWVES
jgi:hypothetical protein